MALCSLAVIGWNWRLSKKLLDEESPEISPELPLPRTPWQCYKESRVAGSLTGGERWHHHDHNLQDKSPTFIYVPGHAGVKNNGKTDDLAAAANQQTSFILLFSQYIALLCQQGISEALLNSKEGDRPLSLKTSFGVSSSCHHKAPTDATTTKWSLATVLSRSTRPPTNWKDQGYEDQCLQGHTLQDSMPTC